MALGIAIEDREISVGELIPVLCRISNNEEGLSPELGVGLSLASEPWKFEAWSPSYDKVITTKRAKETFFVRSFIVPRESDHPQGHMCVPGQYKVFVGIWSGWPGSSEHLENKSVDVQLVDRPKLPRNPSLAFLALAERSLRAALPVLDANHLEEGLLLIIEGLEKTLKALHLRQWKKMDSRTAAHNIEENYALLAPGERTEIEQLAASVGVHRGRGGTSWGRLRGALRYPHPGNGRFRTVRVSPDALRGLHDFVTALMGRFARDEFQAQRLPLRVSW